jgi:hypothetical protein
MKDVDEYEGTLSVDITVNDLASSYSKSLEGIKELRNQSYKVFYALYSRDNPDKDVSKITQDIINAGVKVYQQTVDPSIDTLDKVAEDMISSFPTQTTEDIRQCMMDRGMMELSEKLYGSANAFEFLRLHKEEFEAIENEALK